MGLTHNTKNREKKTRTRIRRLSASGKEEEKGGDRKTNAFGAVALARAKRSKKRHESVITTGCKRGGVKSRSELYGKGRNQGERKCFGGEGEGKKSERGKPRTYFSINQKKKSLMSLQIGDERRKEKAHAQTS